MINGFIDLRKLSHEYKKPQFHFIIKHIFDRK